MAQENEFEMQRDGGGTVYLESGCEYILPDYKGEVRRILLTEARAIPSGKYQSDGELQIAGIVSYRVLYTDAEGKMTEADFTSDYESAIAVDPDLYLDSAPEVRVANCNLRLVGPRKFTVRTALSCEPHLREKEDVGTVGTAFDGRKPELDTRTLHYHAALYGRSSEREYAEEGAKFAETDPKDVEVIGAGGRFRVDDAKAEDGGILLTGALILRAIVRIGDEAPFAVRKEIPVEELIAVDGAKTDSRATAGANVTSVVTSVGAGAEGGAVLTFNAIAEYFAAASDNREATVVADGYLCNAPTEEKIGELRYTELIEALAVNAELSAAAEFEAIGAEPQREIITSDAAVKITETKIESGEIRLLGTVTFRAVGANAGENGEIAYTPLTFSQDFTLPVKTRVRIPDDARVDLHADVCDSEVTVDRTTLYGNCRMNITLLVTREKTVTRLVSFDVCGDETQGTDSTIRVCYPTEDDTLFSLAKHYHVPACKVAVDNALTAEVVSAPGTAKLTQVKKLLIIP